MARIVKSPEERRDEFLQAAQRLFIENGYFKTSVDDICEDVGVAKGLFYYYFRSKEDLVEGIVDDLWEGAVEDYNRIRDMEDLNSLEKLMLFSHVRGEVKLQQTYLAELYINDPNSLLVQKLRERGTDILAPILAEIVSQGVKDGFFDTPWPLEAAMFLIRGGEALISDELGDADAVIRTYMITLDMWERVLGAEKGTFMSLVQEHEGLMRQFAEASGRMDMTTDDQVKEGDD
jgi:AcrR family transcriptional regulator